jgi:hypothetical protein
MLRTARRRLFHSIQRHIYETFLQYRKAAWGAVCVIIKQRSEHKNKRDAADLLIFEPSLLFHSPSALASANQRERKEKEPFCHIIISLHADFSAFNILDGAAAAFISKRNEF